MNSKKLIASILTAVLLFGIVSPVAAIEAPAAPSAPSAPTAPETPTAPTYDEENSSSPQQDSDEQQDRDHDSSNRDRDENEHDEENDSEQSETHQQALNSETPLAEPPPNQQSLDENTGNQDANSQGDAQILTGDATNTAVVDTTTNQNVGAFPTSSIGGSASIANTGNGADSNNSGSVAVASDTTTIQNNSANISNDLNLDTNSGSNEASKNMGQVTIKTGDANTTGTIINSVNSNVAGVVVSEFNVVDDQVGDLVLDFAAGCVSGCVGSDTTIKNSGNGAGSTNTGELTVDTTNTSFQTNDANIINTMVLDSNSGDNLAEKNTGGNTSIETGDANVTANALTFANTNIAGTVIYSSVNIYGDMVGDIIFPEELLGCCTANTTLTNAGNGADTDNLAQASITNTDETFQTNNAVIDNMLYLDATTGNNDANKNTSGNNSITTGDASTDANVVNIANSNVDGGAWWLVLVNEAGNWIGKILGADGSTMAGSPGTEFTMSPTGEIVVTNGGNGAGSTNTGSVTQNTTNTTVQTNTAHVTNVLDLSANTGGNVASKNTGGDNTITSGDATIVANLVNFVNTNITGGGQLFVTVVNVFGSWIGDFVGPGYEKEDELAVSNDNPSSDPAIGGADVNQSPAEQDLASPDNTQTQTSPMPTPVGQTQLVFGDYGSGNGGGGSSIGFVLGSTNTTGEGAPEVVTQAKQDKIITINLAWLILALPFAIFFIARKCGLRLVNLPQTLLPLKKIASALNSLL